MKIDLCAATKFVTCIQIELSRSEVAMAIDAWVASQGVTIRGPRTITVGGKLCRRGRIYVDPSGEVSTKTHVISGRGV